MHVRSLAALSALAVAGVTALAACATTPDVATTNPARGFAWTCPAGLAVTALAAIPGSHALWAAGADNPGLSMRPATALFG